jgi:hypothetical protein
MEIKINTENKTITLLQNLTIKQLNELLERFSIHEDWTIINTPSLSSLTTSSWTTPYTKIGSGFGSTCSCNPKNGGSGICGCILNSPNITC